MRERNYRSLAAFEVALIECLDDICLELHSSNEAEKQIARDVHKIAQDIHAIRVTLNPLEKLNSVRITLMPKTIAVGETSTAVVAATKADGTPFTITSADTVSIAAAVAADVSIGPPTVNADGTVSFVLTGVNPDAGDAISATVDGVVSASPDTLTITAPAPAAVTVTLT